MNMAAYGFYFDSSSCSGCKTCQVACKDKNDLYEGIRFRRVYEVSGAKWTKTDEGAWQPDIVAYNISIACNHCENSPCTDACPTKAMHRGADGIVVVDPEKCIGCRYCEWACPYGAPQYNKDLGVIQKCDFCRDYLAEGKAPVCVSSCPMRALDYGPIEELRSKYGTNANLYPLPDAEPVGARWVVTPHPGANRAMELQAAILNREEVRHG